MDEAVLTALCSAGRKLNFTVGASPRFVSAKNRDGGEWLYDANWCSYDDDGWFKAVELIAESEWSDLAHIEEDFQKLLAARATVRVMVFDAGQSEGGVDAIVETLCKHIRAFNGRRRMDSCTTSSASSAKNCAACVSAQLRWRSTKIASASSSSLE